MKKRVLAALLAGAMAMSTLVGCGGGEAAAEGSVYYLNFKPEADAAWPHRLSTFFYIIP